MPFRALRMSPSPSFRRAMIQGTLVMAKRVCCRSSVSPTTSMGALLAAGTSDVFGDGGWGGGCGCLVTSLGDCVCLLEGKGWVFLGGVGDGGSLRRGGGSGENETMEGGGLEPRFGGMQHIDINRRLVFQSYCR